MRMIKEVFMKKLFFFVSPVLFIFFSMWMFKTEKQFISSIVFIIINYAASIVLYMILKTGKIEKRKAIVIASIMVLSILDQGIKFIINKWNIDFHIFGDIFAIRPTKNLNQTAMFDFFDIEMDAGWILFIKLFAIGIIALCFKFVKRKNDTCFYAFTLFMGAAVSNFLDTLLWDYTLDYVYFYKLTCYDLKDFYVDAAVGLILIALYELRGSNVFYCKRRKKEQVRFKALKKLFVKDKSMSNSAD